MNCPHCRAEITTADLRKLTREELASLRGKLNVALRKTAVAGPGRGHKKAPERS